MRHKLTGVTCDFIWWFPAGSHGGLFDHFSAWSKGRAKDLSNCEMLCVSHNRAKGNRWKSREDELLQGHNVACGVWIYACGVWGCRAMRPRRISPARPPHHCYFQPFSRGQTSCGLVRSDDDGFPSNPARAQGRKCLRRLATAEPFFPSCTELKTAKTPDTAISARPEKAKKLARSEKAVISVKSNTPRPKRMTIRRRRL